jgi:hypothetical protein
VTAEVPEIFKWLEQTPVGAAVRQSLWLFPAIETLHLLGMALLVITVGAFDLRLMGLALRGVRVSELARRLFPWAWAGFAVQVTTGALLFSSEATHMVANPAFRVKMALIALGGAHAIVFRWIACRDMPEWDAASPTPLRGKIAGLISLSIWVGVVAAGRWIGFI